MSIEICMSKKFCENFSISNLQYASSNRIIHGLLSINLKKNIVVYPCIQFTIPTDPTCQFVWGTIWSYENNLNFYQAILYSEALMCITFQVSTFIYPLLRMFPCIGRELVDSCLIYSYKLKQWQWYKMM